MWLPRRSPRLSPRQRDLKAPRTSRWTSIQPHRSHRTRLLLPRRRRRGSPCRSRVSSPTACARWNTTTCTSLRVPRLSLPRLANTTFSPLSPSFCSCRCRAHLSSHRPGPSARGIASRSSATASSSGRRAIRRSLRDACANSVQTSGHGTGESLSNASPSSCPHEQRTTLIRVRSPLLAHHRSTASSMARATSTVGRETAAPPRARRRAP